MPNTIRSPRTRPRRRSFNFRALWWLLTREAAWQVLCRRDGYTMAPYTRRGFCAGETYYVRRLAERMLYYRPERRWLP